VMGKYSLSYDPRHRRKQCFVDGSSVSPACPFDIIKVKVIKER
jgi:hypothetical protein